MARLDGSVYGDIENVASVVGTNSSYGSARSNDSETVKALWPGWFVNSVEVDARSVDGPVVQSVGASNIIDVGEVVGEMRTAGWQPPEWEFEHYGYEPDELTCEQLTCTD